MIVDFFTYVVSLFYETEDSGNVKLLELGCHSDSALFGGDTQSRLAENIREIKEKYVHIGLKNVLCFHFLFKLLYVG